MTHNLIIESSQCDTTSFDLGQLDDATKIGVCIALGKPMRLYAAQTWADPAIHEKFTLLQIAR